MVMALFGACNTSKSNKGITNFTEYCNKIPLVKLPLRIDCGLCGDTLLPDSIVKKYGKTPTFYSGSNPSVIGRIENAKRVYILYSYPGDICYPYLFTYSKQGTMLDSLYLHISTCAGDENLEMHSWSVIKPDLSIDMIDTERHFHIDTLSKSRSLESTYIHKKAYKLNPDGIPTKSWAKVDSIINQIKKD